MTDKEILMYIIKGKGYCGGISCGECPVIFERYFCSDDEISYKRAVESYIVLYGEDEDLFEELL